ncbi:hypothetical protein QO206_13165 [Leeuwenhoekiella aequorea]|uniref:hypothetical protein n=1 Tax=Leeuwenhoekiella aequorea TaxID=283736 RepID=UPI00352D069C|tara:strand:+ start:3859 stop:4128 length:270 start_codon:yes stop_codon:yes gene_type:complete
MKEFKGTKDFEINIQSDKRVILNSASQEDDVDIWAFDDLEVANANAKIFKAAPELLEVLQKIDSLNLEEIYPGFNEETGILKAISKALD